MLVFWQAKWHDVELPTTMDPSWGTTEQTQLALALLKGRAKGKTEMAVLAGVETLVVGKKHGAPQHDKKESGM